ncbi:hypothetical protein B0A50_08512 [Salinomyces thailandicus]|uniref:Uncharacterized protein n=1 Tax=Salinomyces thailandicus TaxID=706561 RepID=A0A4U0TJ47_9PEZI|nr:hypothetical protein B0A50_08512 [Salinomyces thailandica]
MREGLRARDVDASALSSDADVLYVQAVERAFESKEALARFRERVAARQRQLRAYDGYLREMREASLGGAYAMASEVGHEKPTNNIAVDGPTEASRAKGAQPASAEPYTLGQDPFLSQMRTIGELRVKHMEKMKESVDLRTGQQAFQPFLAGENPSVNPAGSTWGTLSDRYDAMPPSNMVPPGNSTPPFGMPLPSNTTPPWAMAPPYNMPPRDFDEVWENGWNSGSAFSGTPDEGPVFGGMTYGGPVFNGICYPGPAINGVSYGPGLYEPFQDPDKEEGAPVRPPVPRVRPSACTPEKLEELRVYGIPDHPVATYAATTTSSDSATTSDDATTSDNRATSNLNGLRTVGNTDSDDKGGDSKASGKASEKGSWKASFTFRRKNNL